MRYLGPGLFCLLYLVFCYITSKYYKTKQVDFIGPEETVLFRHFAISDLFILSFHCNGFKNNYYEYLIVGSYVVIFSRNALLFTLYLLLHVNGSYKLFSFFVIKMKSWIPIELTTLEFIVWCLLMCIIWHPSFINFVTWNLSSRFSWSVTLPNFNRAGHIYFLFVNNEIFI